MNEISAAHAFEKDYERLTELTRQIKASDKPIAELVALYEESVELGRRLHQRLDEAVLRVNTLSGESVEVLLDGETEV